MEQAVTFDGVVSSSVHCGIVVGEAFVVRTFVVALGLAVVVQAGGMLPTEMSPWSAVSTAAAKKCTPENCPPPPPPGADAPKKCVKLYDAGKFKQYTKRCLD
jgi:hypothetical protein